jgi:hypothetical protein
VLTILDWRSGAGRRHRDPAFTHPVEPMDDVDDEDGPGDEESQYHQIPPARRTTSDNSNAVHSPFADTNRYSAASNAASGYSGISGATTMPRQSMDVYGAFSDPPPSGYGAPSAPEAPRVSRTMQYADPYAAVRASVAGSGATASTPPSYESYQGYR